MDKMKKDMAGITMEVPVETLTKLQMRISELEAAAKLYEKKEKPLIPSR